MKEINNIESMIKPDEVHITNDMICLRTNITKKSFIDPVFNTENISYIYNEIQYSPVEWFEEQINNLNKKINIMNDQIQLLTNELSTLKSRITD